MTDTLHLVAPNLAPSDQAERHAALDVARSVLVQAPAGSGKTSLLTQRFLALLAEVDEPGQIVAITFTRAAAAEMRSRILSELETAASSQAPADEDPLSTASLARRALAHSRSLGWNLLDQPSQLRVSTIDSFCRELALQQPLISGLGGNLEIAAQPAVLHRRAARRTLDQLDQAPPPLREAVETLLLWRDNNWAEMESLLAQMLAQRDRWMRDFVLDNDFDLDALRLRLGQPFQRAVSEALAPLARAFELMPSARQEILALARFACEQTNGDRHRTLAEAADFPDLSDENSISDAQSFYAALADFLLTETGFRRAIDKRLGFPADRKREKQRMLDLLQSLAASPDLGPNLAAVRALPPARYTEDDWRIVRAAFTLLAHAAAQLRIVFAEEGEADFTEISQTALAVLAGEQGLPGDATLAFVDGIRHLLIDEFQDTSRRQHELLSHLVAAWSDSEGRTCFVVGDPMQSIYYFRGAEAELFARVRDKGLEQPDGQPLPFTFAQLRSNFRTAHELVLHLNEIFERIFAERDGSGIEFSSAAPARAAIDDTSSFASSAHLHLAFVPDPPRTASTTPEARDARKQLLALRTQTQGQQLDEIVSLIRSHQERIDKLRALSSAAVEGQKKYRVAVLGRTKKVLTTIAEALRKAELPFRAIGIENLKDRSEILDALSLARAVLNPQDRVAWLGVLRAPWCALSLDDLHRLASADDPQIIDQPLPVLLHQRIAQLSPAGQHAAQRVLDVMNSAPALRATAPGSTLGSWIAQLWSRLGGPLCVDAAARANLDLLWNALDSLPEGEQDLLGSALDAALADLTAQPDPQVDENFGVQLMTIHKSKGLEFEVVLVPELQASSGRGAQELLVWLERGLEDSEDTSEPTEFLVAPIQTKGDESGSAKSWVARMRSEREQQEMRRLLYVAATRAREELHLFARPSYKQSSDGSFALTSPRASLLKTAWPALEADVTARFNEWLTAKSSAENTTSAEDSTEENTLAFLAASVGPELVLPVAPTRLMRLPAEAFETVHAAITPPDADAFSSAASSASVPYQRHEGGLSSRVFGTAVHSFFEELARLRQRFDSDESRSALDNFLPRILASIRAAGLDRAQAETLANEALAVALDAARTDEGEWILAPHEEAASEQRWTGVLAGTLRTVQVDRIFRAGAAPLHSGNDVWWIIDYKTAHPDNLDAASALAALRPNFATQLDAYAQLLRNLKGPATEIRAALYYPRMKALDWWTI